MSINGYQKGARAERKTIAVLEKAGYVAARAAGSGGLFDVVALNGQGVRCISVKSGTKYVSAVEREQLQCWTRVPGVSIEIWRWPDRAREPLIEVLR